MLGLRRLIPTASRIGAPQLQRGPTRRSIVVLSRGEQRVKHLKEALEMVRCCAIARFDESVELSVALNVDTKRTDERVRGRVLLPHGTGKVQRVGVFARGEMAEAARNAGADVVGAEELIAEVANGKIEFDRVLATPDVLPLLAKVARVLGPKGLMPSPKRGNVVFLLEEVDVSVRRAKGAEVEFKAQSEGIVHSLVVKISFGPDRLAENIISFLDGCLLARPTRFRGKAPLKITMTSTMGPSVNLDHRLW